LGNVFFINGGNGVRTIPVVAETSYAGVSKARRDTAMFTTEREYEVISFVVFVGIA